MTTETLCSTYLIPLEISDICLQYFMYSENASIYNMRKLKARELRGETLRRKKKIKKWGKDGWRERVGE